MSVVFSVVGARCIVMSASASTDISGQPQAKASTARAYVCEGVGCVTIWGAPEGDSLVTVLRGKELVPFNCSIYQLSDLVFDYLVDELQPAERGLGEVGYHVGGYDDKGEPFLSCIFWGLDRHSTEPQNGPEYTKQDHSPQPDARTILYDGRNDLVWIAISTFLGQLQRGMPVRHDLDSVAGTAWLADFVCRFAAEVTPEVCPPIATHILWPNRASMQVNNSSLAALDPNEISKSIVDHGLDTRSYCQGGMQ